MKKLFKRVTAMGLAMLLVFSTLGLEAFASEEEFISVVEEHDSAEETVSTVEDAKEPLGEVSEKLMEPDSVDSRVLGEQILVSTFAELEKAIANASTGDVWANIRITKDIAFTKTLTLKPNTTVFLVANVNGSTRTLKRAPGFTGTFLQVPQGATLQLNYSHGDNGLLNIDGGSASGITATGSLIRNYGTLLVQPKVNLMRNKLSGSGGALLNETTGKAYFKAGMSYNSATGNGGAVFNRGYYEQNLNLLEVNPGDFEIVGGHEDDRGNHAGQQGGWAYNASTGVMVLNDGKYYSNSASGNGGLIFNNGSVTINDGVYYQNSTSSNGSIVYQLDPNASVTQTGGHVYNNTTGNFAYYIQAGKAYLKDNARIGLSTSETTSNNNGNLYLASGATGYLQATTSSSNVTLRKSNGYNVFNLGTLYMQNSGGAASTYPKIDGASSGPQGIYNQDGSIVMNGGTITANSTGVQMMGGSFSMGGGYISGNGQNGVHFGKVSTVTMTGGTIQNNQYGIYNGTSSSGTITVGGGTIGSNAKAGIYNIGSTTVRSGTITGNGGAGVENAQGTVTVSGGTISSNRASGILNRGGTVTMSGGSILSNSTTGNGGGIQNGGTLTISGGTISGNTASFYGDGIYQNGMFYLHGAGKVATNNDVYLPSESKVITVDSRLTSSSGTLAKITPNAYRNGRMVVDVDYSTLGSSEYAYSNGSQKFALTPNGNYLLRPGDNVDAAANVAKNSIFISTPYTISYNKNTTDTVGNLPSSQTKYWHEGLSLASQIPTRSGYGFQNWNTSSSGGGVTYHPSALFTSNADTVLYAQWKKDADPVVTYDIRYDANGGSGAPGAQVKVHGVSLTLSTQKPSWEGYTFVNWNTRADGRGVTYRPGALFTSNADTMLYAQWEKDPEPGALYSVRFNANGGSGAPGEQVKTHGIPLTLSTLKPTRSGFTFVNWNTRADGSGVSYISGGIYSSDQDVILYAQWQENGTGPITYKVRYDANGGSGAPGEQFKIHGLDVSLSGKIPVRNGYKFLYWTTNANGSGEQYAPNSYYKKDADVTLYAQWEQEESGVNTYRVRYDANGGTGAPGEQMKIAGLDMSLSAKVPTRSGYLFICWNTKANGTGESYAPNALYKKDADVTLYAQWRSDGYVISYRGNGATGGSTPSSYHRVGVKSPLTPNGYYRTGYQFLKWNTATNGAGDSYYDQDMVLDLGNHGETIPLHAIWSPITYLIVYDGNGATGGSTSMSVHIYDTAKALNKNGYTKKGAKFLYWNTKPDGSGVRYEDGAMVKNLTTTRMEQIKLYAIWSDMDIDTGKPEIVPGDVLEFYEGEKVTKEMLLKGVKATGSDGKDLTDQLRITKIAYSKGKLVNGEKQPAYEKTWKTDMAEGDLLDTWFLQMDKKDSPVIHQVTYAVTDSNGKETTLTWDVKVKYNEFPEILAEDRYFTLEEAQNGEITEEELLDRVRAWDLEDCAKEDCSGSHENCLHDPEKCPFAEKLKILNFSAEEFKNFEHKGFAVVSYTIRDRYGKETVCQARVYILEDGLTVPPEGAKQVRFLDQKHYGKSEANGGLREHSKWREDAAYAEVLSKTFSEKVPDEVWEFSPEDVNRVKEFVKKHKIGSEGSFELFLEEFKDNKK